MLECEIGMVGSIGNEYLSFVQKFYRYADCGGEFAHSGLGLVG